MSTAWTRVPSPRIGSNSTLRGVGSIAADAVWSVGSWTNPDGGENTLTQVWNGQEWRLVDSPNGDGTINVLWDVDGSSPTDLWAVGFSAIEIHHPDLATLLLARGNGTSWTIEPPPVTAASSALAAIDMINANDGWAVGTYRPFRDGPARALILRWTGAEWKHIEAPDVNSQPVRLTGVSAASSDNVWAVGYREGDSGAVDHVILHWDGTSWRSLPGPALDNSIRTALFSVAAVSASDAWAVGYSHPSRFSDEESWQAFAIRWNGKEWLPIMSATPLPGPGTASIGGIQLRSVLVHDTVWTAGYRVDGAGEHEIVMAYDGTQFRPEVLPLPSPGEPNNVTGTALSAIAVSPTSGELWTVGWASNPLRVGHGSNVLTRPVRAKKP